MKPVLQALILAERVYEDKTGKKIIAGTLSELHVGVVQMPQVQLPSGEKLNLIPGGTDIGCPSVYMSLTDVVDGTIITFQVVNVSKNQVLFHTGLKLDVKDRLATVEIVAASRRSTRSSGKLARFRWT